MGSFDHVCFTSRQLMALLLLRHAMSLTGDGDEDASAFFSVSQFFLNLSRCSANQNFL